MLRILHTGDWHLGHQLHGFDRVREHQIFLDWLLVELGEQAVDTLLIAGDVFDTANPPASALATWYQFLAEARRRHPNLNVVVIGGNHDSAARLDAPQPVLGALGVTVIGGLPRREGGLLDAERVVLPLRRRDGEVGAWLCAVPFLRPADLPLTGDVPEGDRLIEGVRAVYAAAVAEARARRSPGQALLAAGHCYMTGTELSMMSERRVLGGNQHALPVEVFDADLAYVALGHLHRAQRVGGREGVRYAGSPLPLSMTEADYPHQVMIVDIEGEQVSALRPRLTPRPVALLRLPVGEAQPLAAVLVALGALPNRVTGEEEALLPFLEVAVRLERPAPGLRQEVEAAVGAKAVRLVKISTTTTGTGAALGDLQRGEVLRDLHPEEVFRRRWSRDHEEEPGVALIEAFHALLERVDGGPPPSPAAPPPASPPPDPSKNPSSGVVPA